jgi:aminoglycoside 3-N-acetyltransferase
VQKFLNDIGVKSGIHLLVHSGFRAIKTVFPEIRIDELIELLKHRIGRTGSLIMPAFSYCFKKTIGVYDMFDQDTTPSRVGAVSEVFRKSEGVIRTASPTHSFSLWGTVKNEIDSKNAPESPLGRGSVLDWLSQADKSYVLMLGVDFKALSFGHYLESASGVPWADVSPWTYMNIEKTGVSKKGEQALIELPGCSKGFVTFEKYLRERGYIKPVFSGSLRSYLIPVDVLLREGLIYYSAFPEYLLCPSGQCKACDVRWEFYLNIIQSSIKGKDI